MKENNPCWSVVPVRVNERTRSGVNASWQKPKPAGQVSDADSLPAGNGGEQLIAGKILDSGDVRAPCSRPGQRHAYDDDSSRQARQLVGGNTMDVKTLNNTPPWEWPEDAGTTILGVLTDEHAEDSDRVLAAELAGDVVVINDELADALLAVVGSSSDPDELRGMATISLGPALEHADTFGFEDGDDLLISEAAFLRIQQSLHELFLEADVPQDVRRRILEASGRAPQEWHDEAVRSVYSRLITNQMRSDGKHLISLTIVSTACTMPASRT
jgi:hypothetical protein